MGVKVIDGKKYIVMVNGENEKPMEIEKVPLEQSVIYFKAECDVRNRADKGYFYYSLDGIRWKAVSYTHLDVYKRQRLSCVRAR